MTNLPALRVLIVEDDYLVTLAIRHHVQDLGHQVVGEALDGLEAIGMAEALQPDVILMDVRMPVLDGLSATRRLKVRGAAPVIILTGDDTDEVLAKARAAGACGFLSKLPSRADLEQALRKALSSHRTRHAKRVKL